MLLIIAFFVYFYRVDAITPGIQGDELTVAKAGEYVLSLPEYVPFVDINYGHSTPLLYLTGLSIEWFGRTLVAIRLPSIIFGALSVGAFYILLRLFFSKTVSVFASFMMLFCYPLVAVSRLAYEITPALFFQILTVIFLYLANKTKDIRFYAALGISLGAGFYTYVGFRTFALIVIGVLIFQFYKSLRSDKNILQKFAVFVVSMFIVSVPLFSYSINHAPQLMARAQSLSLFNQGLPVIEVYKELQGATFRLSNLFFPNGNTDHNPNGDPNLKINPSRVSMFDFVTFLLFINGIIFLITKNKKLFLLLTVFASSPLVNDIFSLERIPEGHYYGIGHPNTLRIAGIIPIIYFIVAFGLYEIKSLFIHQARGFYTTILSLITSVVIALNWHIYFKQPFNEYVYFYNGVRMLNVANINNTILTKTIYLSPTFADDERVKYFTNRDVTMIPYEPKVVDDIFADAKTSDVIIFDPNFNVTLGKEVWEKIQSDKELFQGEILVSPDNKIDAIIFSKF